MFLDVGSVPFGVDFREHLKEQIAAHDVVLVIIGPQWAQMMQERASQPNDFVRIEIENALALRKHIIPVRVMGAAMPNFSALPTSIQDLQWRNAAEVRRPPDFEIDCARLTQGIQDYFARLGSSSSKQQVTISSELVVSKRSSMPHSRDLLPQPFEWIEIPGKRYSIAKYPVTNSQFAMFIDAGGYTKPKWWTNSGWQQCEREKWTHPRYWTDAKWNGIEQPVVGVSWYEGMAYCQWLSEVTGETIMLPTEEQWEYAAQGEDSRLYPWGNEWDCSKCNNSVKPSIVN